MYHCIPWSITIISRYHTRNAQARTSVDLCAAHDLFIKDIFQGSCEKNEWFFISAYQLIWQKNDMTYVGWTCEEKRIVRISGFFNPTTFEWNKKHTIPIVQDAGHAFFEWHVDDNFVRSVSLAIEIEHTRYCITGAPRYAKN